MMDKLAKFIINKRLIICIVFGALIVVSAICIPFVDVNYNDVSYLPKDSPLKVGIGEMYDDFGNNGNASVMVKNVDIAQILQAKSEIADINGVKDVVWIDDILDSYLADIPEKMLSGNNAHSITRAESIGYLLEVFYALPDKIGDFDITDISGLTALLNEIEQNLSIKDRPDRQKLTKFLQVLIISMGDMDDAFSLEMISQFKPQLDGFYKDNNALFQLLFDEDDYSKTTINAIKNIRELDYDFALIGSSATTYNSLQSVSSTTNFAMIVVFVVVLIILFLTTSSYWEPVIYLITIGVAVVINMGTNIVFGQISYMTQGVASILQLALTMDYSIFLLNRYKRERKEGKAVKDAMKIALKTSLSPISASSITTIASFVALMFMRYKLGLDIGMVLTKGIIISFLSVYLVLPALIVYTHKLIERSEHKSFNFSFKRVSKFLVKTRFFLPFIIIAIILPTAYFQSQNSFTYGSETSLESPGTIGHTDRLAIEQVFGKQNQLVILLPVEQNVKELAISQGLLELSGQGVRSVQSLSLIEDMGMDSMLPASFLAQFKGREKYTRIIVVLSVESEGKGTDELIDKITNLVDSKLDGANYYMLGNSSATIEIKNIVDKDYEIITYVSLALVGLVLIFTYKSLIIPILLLFVIQFSIYVNMTFPYVMGQPMVFVGYLLVSAILLGATIDYAILLTSHYIENRQTMNKFDSAQQAMSQSARALITSASILTFAGFSISIISGMPATAIFGSAIGRGGVASFLLVMFLLPQLLMLLDKSIRYTTWKGREKMISDKPKKPQKEKHLKKSHTE